jgi:hypothetical protein
VRKSILFVFVHLFALSTGDKTLQSNAVEAHNAQENRLRVIASSEPSQPSAAQAVYLKWRQEASADELSNLRFALATVTRRTGNEDAEVEFWSVGWASLTEFEIRPLYVEKLSDGGSKQEQTGEVTKSVVESYSAGNEPGHGFGVKTVFLVKPNTNALEIKWTGYVGGGIQNLAKVTVFLRDEPSSNMTTVTGDR